MPEYITDDINIFPEDSDREDCDKKNFDAENCVYKAV